MVNIHQRKSAKNVNKLIAIRNKQAKFSTLVLKFQKIHQEIFNALFRICTLCLNISNMPNNTLLGVPKAPCLMIPDLRTSQFQLSYHLSIKRHFSGVKLKR